MNEREKYLSDIRSYIEETDKELTLVLQSLQWDRQHLLQGKSLVTCKYEPGHRIPEEIREKHESQCFYKKEGYTEEDMLLPEPLDSSASTLVKLSNNSIQNILRMATISDRNLERGDGCKGEQPMSLERLQATYTPGERGAIHNAVVATVPACHDLSDLILHSDEKNSGRNEPKSRLEILSELRDMKRRRTKYRVASKTRNYSDVLRDVIRSQMELYTGVKNKPEYIKPKSDMPNPKKMNPGYSYRHDKEEDFGHNGQEKFSSHKGSRREPRDDIEVRGRIQQYDRHNKEREYANNAQRKHNENDIGYNSFRDEERRYNTTDKYSDECAARYDSRNWSREEKKRQNTSEEHRYEKERKYDRDTRDNRNSSRERDKIRQNTTKEYRYDNERRHDAETKDRRKEEKHDKYDKNKIYDSYSSHEKDKREKRRRRDGHDDYSYDVKNKH